MQMRRFVARALLAPLWPDILQAHSAPLEVDTAASRPSEALHAVSFGRLEAVADGPVGHRTAAAAPRFEMQKQKSPSDIGWAFLLMVDAGIEPATLRV
jgi:hypothetical protein